MKKLPPPNFAALLAAADVAPLPGPSGKWAAVCPVYERLRVARGYKHGAAVVWLVANGAVSEKDASAAYSALKSWFARARVRVQKSTL